MSLEDVVSRLKWICSVNPRQESDATHDTEGMGWILWALTELDLTPVHENPIPAMQNLWRNDPGRVLVLYEPQGL